MLEIKSRALLSHICHFRLMRDITFAPFIPCAKHRVRRADKQSERTNAQQPEFKKTEKNQEK